MISWIGLHEFADAYFGITQKPLYITSSTCQTGFERKYKVNFFQAFWQSSFKIFLKNALHAMAILGYLAKLKGGLGLAFGAHFLRNFSIKMFLV